MIIINNEMYEKAMCKIEKDQHCKPKCVTCIGATGPTGPTGPAGPTTIAIGRTTTGQPGSQATVINEGTNTNAILDFTIPAGATGATQTIISEKKI